eukprot:scaffold98560_cov25-Prasinocladus_malaysianus.AAC.1
MASSEAVTRMDLTKAACVQAPSCQQGERASLIMSPQFFINHRAVSQWGVLRLFRDFRLHQLATLNMSSNHTEELDVSVLSASICMPARVGVHHCQIIWNA